MTDPEVLTLVLLDEFPDRGRVGETSAFTQGNGREAPYAKRGIREFFAEHCHRFLGLEISK